MSWRRRSKPAMSEMPGVFLAFERARHVAHAVLQAELQRRIQLPVGVQVVDDARRLERAARSRRWSSYLSSRRSNTIQLARIRAERPGEAAHRLGRCRRAAHARVERLQRHRHRVAFDRLAVPARGRAPAVLAVGIAMLEAARQLPQFLAIRRAHEGREEIFGQRARGQRRVRIQRLEVRRRAACCVWSTPTSKAQCSLPLEALREAEVREGARTVLGRLRVDARLDLRALPGARAHADARRVGVELVARRHVRIRRTASSRSTGGSRRRAGCAPDSRRSRPCRRASHRCAPRSVTRPSQTSTLPREVAWSETRSSPLGVFVGHVAQAGADAVAVLVHAHFGARQQARRIAREHVLVLHFAVDAELSR